MTSLLIHVFRYCLLCFFFFYNFVYFHFNYVSSLVFNTSTISCLIYLFLGFDDALDAFGVHAIGGIVGGISTGFFATSQVAVPYSFGTTAGLAINGVYYSGLTLGGHQLAIQIVGICFAAGWSFCGTYIILQVIDKTIGLRVSESDEDIGLDSSLHGEQINKQKIHQDLEPKPIKDCSTYEVGVPDSADV